MAVCVIWNQYWKQKCKNNQIYQICGTILSILASGLICEIPKIDLLQFSCLDTANSELLTLKIYFKVAIKSIILEKHQVIMYVWHLMCHIHFLCYSCLHFAYVWAAVWIMILCWSTCKSNHCSHVFSIFLNLF